MTSRIQLFSHLLVTLQCLKLVVSESNSTGGGDAESIPIIIFWPVVVSSLLAGGIIGSIATVVIGCVARRCFIRGTERVQFQKEADLNESKRYLRNRYDEDDNDDREEEGVTLKVKPKTPLKVNNSAGTLKNNHTTTTTTTAATKLKNKTELKRINSTRIAPVTTAPNMRRSISLGESIILRTNATTDITTQEDQSVEELYVENDNSTEHYYTCDMQTQRHHNQPLTPSVLNKPKSDTVSTGQLERKRNPNNHKNNGDTPQYCNVGFKIKQKERYIQ